MASLEAAAAWFPEPDLVIVLGDLVVHGSPGAGFTRRVFANMTSTIARTFPNNPDVCLVPLGNNDVYPNYHVDLDGLPSYYESQAAAAASCGLDASSAALFRSKGYYAVTPSRHPRLRVVVLNTNVYSTRNCPAPSTAGCGDDPLGQLAWLASQLADAARRGLAVHVHGHIPPALDSFARRSAWSAHYVPRFWAVLEAHPEVLAGLFFGHWHSAEVRSSSSAAAAAAAAPQVLSAISPVYANNPVWYSATCHNESYRLEAFEQWALDLDAAGRFPNFVRRPRVTPPGGLTNADYQRWVATWTAPEGEEAFVRFFEQFKAGHHGKGLACTAADARFQDCATCTGACRRAFACLNREGLTASAFDACVAGDAGG